MNKNGEAIAAVNPDAGPIIRSYNPRSMIKRLPGAILNWALTPNQQKAGYIEGFDRNVK